MGEHGATLYADEVHRVSLSMVRAGLAMKRQRWTPGPVRLQLGTTQQLELEVVSSPGAGAAARASHLRCPNRACGALVRVIGHHATTGWGCRRCGAWKYRSRAQIASARAAALRRLRQAELGGAGGTLRE